MPSAWSLDGQHPDLGAEEGAFSSVQIKQLMSSDDHAALLQGHDNFDSVPRKKDFLAEGVHTASGVKNGEAELQPFSFEADQFTPVEAKEWLRERGLGPPRLPEATGSRATPTVESGRKRAPAQGNDLVVKDITRRAKPLLGIVDFPVGSATRPG
jgi:hypothetical protein